jgi:hypothetical protein
MWDYRNNWAPFEVKLIDSYIRNKYPLELSITENCMMFSRIKFEIKRIVIIIIIIIIVVIIIMSKHMKNKFRKHQ